MIPTGYNWALNGKTNAILKKRRWISPRRIWNNNADKESKAIPSGMETHKWKIDICKVYTTNLNIGVTVVLVFSWWQMNKKSLQMNALKGQKNHSWNKYRKITITFRIITLIYRLSQDLDFNAKFGRNNERHESALGKHWIGERI